jgi:thioredoxin 1
MAVSKNGEKDWQMTENKATKPIVLNEVTFDRTIAESELPLLFEFWASWCHHCTALSPIIDEIAEEMGGQIIVGQINCDLNRDLCKRYEVKAVPTLFLAKDGKVVGTTVNPSDKETLVAWVKSMIA